MTPYILLAISPLALIAVLILVFKRPLVVAAPITFVYTLLATFMVWKIDSVYAQGAVVKGIMIAIDILLIIFGAILFLQFLKRTGVVKSIEEYLCSISSDQRIQAIILAWFFLSFIEGTSGFGTPIAIVAPLLVGIGFPATLAVILSLLGVGAGVAFGAVGTPIRIGLAELPTHAVPFYTALINLFAGVLIPIFLVIALVRFVDPKDTHSIKEMIPFAIWAGFCLTVPYFLASFMGPEFPTIVGSLVGLVVISYTTKRGIFVPKKVWRLSPRNTTKSEKISFTRVLVPYVSFITILLITKFFLGSKTLSLAPGLKHTIYFFNPIIAFVLAVIIFMVLYKIPSSTFFDSAKDASGKLLKPLVVIFCISSFVQLMIISGYNHSGLPSMIELMTAWLVTPLLPLIAPFIGTLGAFISGSATVSNLLFGNLQYKAASAVGINEQIILAEQTVGAGVGNTISLTDITVVQAAVQIHNEERTIIKSVFLYVFVYLLFVGAIGMALVYLL